jgi:hypothetical protein
MRGCDQLIERPFDNNVDATQSMCRRSRSASAAVYGMIGVDARPNLA